MIECRRPSKDNCCDDDEVGALDAEDYAEEKRHFDEVVWSFETYTEDFRVELETLQTSLLSLTPEELELWGGNPEEYMGKIRERMAVNQR
ncbi:hypothetical protein Pmar_PMAR015108, partial [Perkinsus marinus ATCC 50983]